MPTLEELQTILDSKEPLEIEVQEDGSIKAVPMGTAVKRTVKTVSLQDALAEADAHAARINQCHVDLKPATWEEMQAAVVEPVVEESSD